MSQLLAIGTAVPPYRITQETAMGFVRQLFAKSPLETERLLPIFHNAQIDRRFISAPVEWYLRAHDFASKNALYRRVAVQLIREVVERVCAQKQVSPHDIDHIFFVSTTGLSTPSLDAHLFNLFDFKPRIRRTPIWGLGCAGGVAGLARAHDWLCAYPERLALVVAVELCSLTFIASDLSKSNFVATALFGDGCGAALIAGNRSPFAGAGQLELCANESLTWKDSLQVMGWEVTPQGLKVVFSQSIPGIVQRQAAEPVQNLLASLGLAIEDLDAFVAHPGGAKVIEAYCQALGLREEQVHSMRAVLRDYGNMSSATVFFVIDHYLRFARRRPGVPLLSAALGPGFSSELLVMRRL